MAVLKDHERAKKAWELVNGIPSDKADAYAALVKSAPVMILTNGLGQTLAFFISKKKKGEYGLLYKHLDAWLSSTCIHQRGGELMERVINQDSQSFRRTTEEALAFLSWVKRFAAAKAPNKAEAEG